MGFHERIFFPRAASSAAHGGGAVVFEDLGRGFFLYDIATALSGAIERHFARRPSKPPAQVDRRDFRSSS
jgi:Ser/Thr protein kinase RdoA (MazF antagonist)